MFVVCTIVRVDDFAGNHCQVLANSNEAATKIEWCLFVNISRTYFSHASVCMIRIVWLLYLHTLLIFLWDVSVKG